MWICKRRKLADFDQKAWGIAHGFEHGRFREILEIAQTHWNASKTVIKWFVASPGNVCVDLKGIRTGRKFAYFEQKAWAISHGFDHGRFREIMEIASNSLKRLQNRSKMICDCLRDCLCWFSVHL